MLFALVSGTAFAAPMEVVPSNVGSMNIIFGNPTVPRGPSFEIEVHASCYGTNLRNVSHPLNPASVITMNLALKKTSTTNTNVSVQFSADMTQRNFSGAPAVLTSSTAGVTVEGRGNYFVARIPSSEVLPLVFTAAGDFDVEAAMGIFQGLNFTQSIAQTDEYASWSSDISGASEAKLANNGGKLMVYASFPGAGGFCGGYYSPLMLFFSDKRPEFRGQSKFPLIPNVDRVYWPEKDAPGFFLAYDRNENGLIENSSELFSNGDGIANGFEALRPFDSNGDGLVNKKDKEFAKLLLWRDVNGDGISQKGELEPASKKVSEISLKYDNKVHKSFADRAEVKQASKFTYTKANGKKAKGDILDVWFAPALAPEQTASNDVD